MQAIRVHPPSPGSSGPWSETNTAPSSALRLDKDVPVPKPRRPGELLVRIRASTVIRDSLTWPETYAKEYAIPGHDFAGTIVSTAEGDESNAFKAGDEVFGMVHADRGSTWAEYALIKAEEACIKPKSLSWEQAAALPLSALTAYQALFTKANFTVPTFDEAWKKRNEAREVTEKSVLITGATGGVGLYLVRLGRLAGLHVCALTSSSARNRDFLSSLGADEVLETADLDESSARFDAIIDTVGGEILQKCWARVAKGGTLVSVDTASHDFVAEHQKAADRADVNAVWFIVEPSGADMQVLSMAIDLGVLQTFVARSMPLTEARAAYDQASRRSKERGKIVLVV